MEVPHLHMFMCGVKFVQSSVLYIHEGLEALRLPFTANGQPQKLPL